jgi:large subunit ribosomal protein LP2
MRYTAAYLLAVLGGNRSPDVADIAKILGSVGIECDEKRAQKVVDACKGRNVDEIIANGMEKIDDASILNTSAVTTNAETSAAGSTAPIPVPGNSAPSRTPSPPGSPLDTDFVSLYFVS